jgi:hypothetical protein
MHHCVVNQIFGLLQVVGTPDLPLMTAAHLSAQMSSGQERQVMYSNTSCYPSGKSQTRSVVLVEEMCVS